MMAPVGAMSIAAAGFGAGLAPADPPFPTPPPWPIPAPDDGPGANVAAPGNPAPPGRDFLPPPGHGEPMPQDAVVPMWAPWQPVVRNTALNTWGLWWNGSFQTL
jgi:hypothetical protein